MVIDHYHFSNEVTFLHRMINYHVPLEANSKGYEFLHIYQKTKYIHTHITKYKIVLKLLMASFQS